MTFLLPVLDVCLSSDFIAGFCGETESDHQQTLELLRKVKYTFAFCFPYSMRQVCRHLLWLLTVLIYQFFILNSHVIRFARCPVFNRTVLYFGSLFSIRMIRMIISDNAQCVCK